MVSGETAPATPAPPKFSANASGRTDSVQRHHSFANPDIVRCLTAKADQFGISSRTALPDPRSAEENSNSPRAKPAPKAITMTPARPAHIAFIAQSPIAVAVLRYSIRSRRSSDAAIRCIGILEPGMKLSGPRSKSASIVSSFQTMSDPSSIPEYR